MRNKTLFLTIFIIIVHAIVVCSSGIENPFMETGGQNYSDIKPGQTKIVIDGKEVCRAGFFENNGSCIFGYDSIINKRLADMYAYRQRTISDYSYVFIRADQRQTDSNSTPVNVYVDLLKPNVDAIQLSYQGGVESPVFSPKGGHVACIFEEKKQKKVLNQYYVDKKIGIVNIKSKQTRYLDLGAGIMNTEISWSPDQQYIAYTSMADNWDGKSRSNNCIKAIDVETLNAFYIYCNRQNISPPQWSPSGAHILFHMDDKAEQLDTGFGGYGVSSKIYSFAYYTIDIKGKNMKTLTKSKKGHELGDASWTADGEHVIVLLFEDKNDKLDPHRHIKVRYDGSKETEVADEYKEIIVNQEFFPYFVHP